MTMHVLDLFSGIGGFSLGLERTGGFQTVAFCEIDPFARRVLAKHWPGTPLYDDVRTLTAARLAADGIRIDVICGGFPCQDISAAGGGAGIDGERSGLWREYARIIGEVGPTFVLIENSPLLRSRGLGRVLKDLWTLGYDAEWHVIPASAFGACHERERIWVLAYPEGYRCGSWRARGLVDGVAGLPDAPRWDAGTPDGKAPWPDEPALLGVDDEVPHRVDRGRSLGNALVPDIPEFFGNVILAAEAATPQPKRPTVVEPEKAALAPTTAAYTCPTCGLGGEELDLTEGADGQWAIPLQDRFRHCHNCDAFIDVGWASWSGHDPDQANG